jgi:hypothetical protein
MRHLGIDRGRLVRAVIVHFQKHIELRWHVRLNGAQKLQEFAAAMASMRLADGLARGYVQ